MQAGTYGGFRTSIESSGSNHAASHHQDMPDISLMPQSQHVGPLDHHDSSMAASLQSVLRQHGVQAAVEAEAVQQLKVSQHAVQERSSNLHESCT